MLENRHTLSDYNIQEGNTLIMRTSNLQICVKTLYGVPIKLKLRPHDTIDNVKAMLF